MNLLYRSDILRPQNKGEQACPGGRVPTTSSQHCGGCCGILPDTVSAYIPFPLLLPPGRVKPGCDSEHLSHRKAISQLVLLTDCAKPRSSENCSELNVISHHYIYATIKKKLSMLQKENIVSHKPKLWKEETKYEGKEESETFILTLLITLIHDLEPFAKAIWASGFFYW